MVDVYQVRKELAVQYISGEGIEVGALHAPLEVPEGTKVHYVDRMSATDLRKQYPELSAVNLIDPDIVDDGEKLSKIQDNVWDFVIANHMIEHCQNPIDAIQNFLRVLKEGGILYMGVPDKRYTFDLDRPLTDLDHLVRDYKEGPEWSKQSHYQEYVCLVDKVPEEQVAARVQLLLNMDYSIHFHVWKPDSFLEMLSYCQGKLGFPFTLEKFQENDFEFICILKKTQNHQS
jgi:predicted SAM-dependent methyltransferase